jgi:hypothetical protein
MSKILLEDYADFLVEIAPEVKEVLETTCQDAARVISPAGLKDYLYEFPDNQNPSHQIVVW